MAESIDKAAAIVAMHDADRRHGQAREAASAAALERREAIRAAREAGAGVREIARELDLAPSRIVAILEQD